MVQPAVLNRIEKGKVIPDESTVKKIHAALAASMKPAGRR
jgi:predicted transcriptional regulator